MAHRVISGTLHCVMLSLSQYQVVVMDLRSADMVKHVHEREKVCNSGVFSE